MKRRLALALASTAVLVIGCAPDPAGDVDPVEEELRIGQPARIQAGQKLFVLGVTDDDQAIFQEGTTIYATALHPGARRQFVAETGPGVGIRPPLVFTSGRVAFIWPDSDFTGTKVSRLVVWTAAGGARGAASASLGWRRAAAASPDSHQVVFIANVGADGATGDLVTAAADLSPGRTAGHVSSHGRPRVDGSPLSRPMTRRGGRRSGLILTDLRGHPGRRAAGRQSSPPASVTRSTCRCCWRRDRAWSSTTAGSASTPWRCAA
jgi:hypothetical protein